MAQSSNKEELSIVWVWPKPHVRGMGCVIGGHVLTAAHCIRRAPKATMPGYDQVAVAIAPLAAPKRRITLFVTGYEPCLDVAILGTSTLSGIDVPEKQHDRFDHLLAEIEEAEAELSLDLTIIPPDAGDMRLRLFNCQGEWVSGRVRSPLLPDRCSFSLLLDREGSAPYGTSGTPVFSAESTVIGLLSIGRHPVKAGITAAPETHAGIVYLKNALPGWFLLHVGQGAEERAAWWKAHTDMKKKGESRSD